jgi:hypothetical protein
LRYKNISFGYLNGLYMIENIICVLVILFEIDFGYLIKP